MPISLVEALAQVPDPRDPRGVRHPLAAILSLAVVAILAGNTGPQAIHEFGRRHGTPLAHALGFRRGKTPAQSTLSEVFRALDAAALEQALSRWIASRQQDAGWRAIALDGKAVRGSADGEAPCVHLLSAYAPEAKAVLAQMRVDAKTNERKASLELLGILPLSGKIVTGDAAFAQKEVAEKIREAGGDHVLVVKDNQKGLREDVRVAPQGDPGFSPLPAEDPGRAGAVGQDGRRGARAAGDPRADEHDGARGLPGGLGGRLPGVRGQAGARGEGGADGGDGLRDNEPEPGGGGCPDAVGSGARALGDGEQPALGA